MNKIEKPNAAAGVMGHNSSQWLKFIRDNNFYRFSAYERQPMTKKNRRQIQKSKPPFLAQGLEYRALAPTNAMITVNAHNRALIKAMDGFSNQISRAYTFLNDVAWGMIRLCETIDALSGALLFTSAVEIYAELSLKGQALAALLARWEFEAPAIVGDTDKIAELSSYASRRLSGIQMATVNHDKGRALREAAAESEMLGNFITSIGNSASLPGAPSYDWRTDIGERATAYREGGNFQGWNKTSVYIRREILAIPEYERTPAEIEALENLPENDPARSARVTKDCYHNSKKGKKVV